MFSGRQNVPMSLIGVLVLAYINRNGQVFFPELENYCAYSSLKKALGQDPPCEIALLLPKNINEAIIHFIFI